MHRFHKILGLFSLGFAAGAIPHFYAQHVTTKANNPEAKMIVDDLMPILMPLLMLGIPLYDFIKNRQFTEAAPYTAGYSAGYILAVYSSIFICDNTNSDTGLSCVL